MARDTVINNKNYKEWCIANAFHKFKPEIHKKLWELYQKTKEEEDSAGREWIQKSQYN
jgi:hypothetical protein